jgi:predicted PurR-regulated permease PerM
MIPKHDQHVEAVEQIKTYTIEQLEAQLEPLLLWLQDAQGPLVAQIIDHIVACGTELTPTIEALLKNSSQAVQNVLLQAIVPRLPFFSKLVLAEAIEQLVKSEDQIIQQRAKKVLEGFEQ